MRIARCLAVDQFLESLSGAAVRSGGLSFAQAAVLCVHAVLIGGLLSFVTGWINHQFNGKQKAIENDALVSASSVAFLCVGMAVVMILVEDNLARAFAIGAAVALVRFRVKMAGKFLGIAMLYGVLTGMACGVHRVDIAWGLAGIFMGLLGGLLLVRRALRRPKPATVTELERKRAA
jgi:hypothetical protein